MKVLNLGLVFLSMNAQAYTCPSVMQDSRFSRYEMNGKPIPSTWNLIKEQLPVVWVKKTPFVQEIKVDSPTPINVKFLTIVHPCFTRDAMSCGFPHGVSISTKTRITGMARCWDQHYHAPDYPETDFCASEFYDGMIFKFVNGGNGGDINSLQFKLDGIKTYRETNIPVCIYGSN